jgi:hypothetical protein
VPCHSDTSSAGGGELTYLYDVRRDRVSFWNFDLDVYRIENLRGIAVGPSDFQRRLPAFRARARRRSGWAHPAATQRTRRWLVTRSATFPSSCSGYI